MTINVHKILINNNNITKCLYFPHVADIIKADVLPIGQLSEYPQEPRNQEYRRYREINFRKIKCVATNPEIFNPLLISSGPLPA